MPPLSGHNRRFCPSSLDGRQPIFPRRSKNPSILPRLKVLCSFEETDLRADEAKAADNTCCIIKAF